MKLYGLSNITYELDASDPRSVKVNGESQVYLQVKGIPRAVAKVYIPANVDMAEKEEKLKYMLYHPLDPSMLPYVAWPKDLLYDKSGSFKGFAMEKVASAVDLSDLYAYPPGRFANITLGMKLTIAKNICRVVDALLERGYLLSDFNPNNIKVDPRRGTVYILDIDSCQFYDASTGRTYRCIVGFPGCIAPELLEIADHYGGDAYARAPLPTFTPGTDAFALAIHIFRLTMNGYTPFNGILKSQDSISGNPGLGDDAVKKDSFCFKPGYQPLAVAVPALSEVPPSVAALFFKSFVEGRIDPHKRASAAEWISVLNEYQSSLVCCPANSNHEYYSALPSCPWCAADKRYENLTGKKVSCGKPVPKRQTPAATAQKQVIQTIHGIATARARQRPVASVRAGGGVLAKNAVATTAQRAFATIAGSPQGTSVGSIYRGAGGYSQAATSILAQPPLIKPLFSSSKISSAMVTVRNKAALFFKNLWKRIKGYFV